MWLRAILSSSLTAVAGAIQIANLCCFWFNFRCKCTAIPRSDLHLKSVVSPDARIEPAALLLTAELNFAETLALLIKPYLSEGYPSLRFAASLADTSVRTLLRRLSECGTSYQALIDELRFKLARDLLLESDTLIGDIAVATGIRDKGNFARMFRRVGGLSPREFRKAQSKT